MPGSYQEQLEREAARWSDHLEARQIKRSWTQSSVVLEHINRMVTGDAATTWVQWIDREFLSQTERNLALSLGCNYGQFERQLVASGLFRALDGFDISPPAIAKAQEAAQRENVSAHFFVADANTIELPPERYDVVFSVMAMHHFEQLEYVLAQVDRSLKPNGFLILNEFVGASRFQWSQHQQDLATSVLHLLEPSRRQLRDGTIREAIGAPPLEAMLQSDPFEAIRSAEIKTQVAKRFDIVECRDYGGSILHLVLHDIVHNFDETRETDREVLATFCRLEELLLRLGLIESDFTVLVAKKRATLAQTEPERNALAEEVRLLRNELGRQNADLDRLRQHLKAVESGVSCACLAGSTRYAVKRLPSSPRFDLPASAQSANVGIRRSNDGHRQQAGHGQVPPVGRYVSRPLLTRLRARLPVGDAPRHDPPKAT